MRGLSVGLVLCGLCGCTKEKQVKVDEHQDVQLDEHQHLEQHEEASTTTGAIDKTATTRMQDVGVVAQAADGSITVARVSRGHPLQLPAGSKILGTMPVGPMRETGSQEHQAPSSATVTSSGAEDEGLDLRSHLDAKRVEDQTTRIGPLWWLWGALALGLGAAGVAAWKFSLPGRVAAFFRAP